MEAGNEGILQKLLSWEDKDGLAVLSDQQKETISEIAEIAHIKAGQFATAPKKVDISLEVNELHGGIHIQTANQLAVACVELEESISKEINADFLGAESEILQWEKQIGQVDELISSVLSALDDLEVQYNTINEKTDSLRSTCLEMITKKEKLNAYVEEIDRNLKYFADVEKISAQLNSFTFSILNDSFPDILKRINECIAYMTEHSDYVEAPQYLLRYRQCLSIALNRIRQYVKESLETSTAQALEYLAKFDAEEVTRATSSTNAYAALYGKVRGPAAKIKKAVGYLEENLTNHPEYEVALLDCQNLYIAQREALIKPSIAGSVQDILNMKDTCALLRSGCTLMMRIVQDEYDLYFEFFVLRCPEFENFLENLLMVFYDGLRSRLIKVTHMETLAELCSILRLEMLTEYVAGSENLSAFVRMTLQLLADIQERLIYRAHIYVQEDILGYKPAPGDLAYPEKLEMIESIAESLQQQPSLGGLRRSDSQLSMISVTSSVYDGAPKSRSGTSPADLHGMWYPPLRRALLCLSKLSRCADRTAFQGLSQEILQAACTSIGNAAAQISSEKSPIDGLLFQIKHLLILREQIAPFQVDFAVKEINLDFSHIKTTAMNVLQKPSRIFALSTNNALLEFLVDGAPHVKEQLKDSRRLADRQLKISCESFINLVANQVVGPVIDFVSKAEEFSKEQSEKKLSAEPWAKAEVLSDIVAESQRNIGIRIPTIQRSMQLYIANKETEFILYKPIKNQVVSTFLQLKQILLANYDEEDRLIVNMTSPDQLNISLSSVPNRTRVKN